VLKNETTQFAIDVEKLKWGQIVAGRVVIAYILTEIVKSHRWVAFILDPKSLEFRIFKGQKISKY
jgi:hypothetical protein